MSGIQAAARPQDRANNARTRLRAKRQGKAEDTGAPKKDCRYEPCQRVFAPKRSWHDFCSDECRRKYWRSRKDIDRVIAAMETRLERIEKHLGIER